MFICTILIPLPNFSQKPDDYVYKKVDVPQADIEEEDEEEEEEEAAAGADKDDEDVEAADAEAPAGETRHLDECWFSHLLKHTVHSNYSRG